MYEYSFEKVAVVCVTKLQKYRYILYRAVQAFDSIHLSYHQVCEWEKLGLHHLNFGRFSHPQQLYLQKDIRTFETNINKIIKCRVCLTTEILKELLPEYTVYI